MLWWYERSGQRGGPVTEVELLALIGQGDLSATNLVWRDGFSEWTRLGDLPSLAAQLPIEPPPLPPTLPTGAIPQSIASTTQAFRTARIALADSEPEDHSSWSNPSTANTVEAPATWYRFFARQIDICLLGFPAIFLAFMALGLVIPPALSLKMQNPIVANLTGIALLCLIGPVIEAATASAFGNTPGKALFGLKVLPLEGGKLSFGEQAKRAYRVTVYGLGLYLPFISLFTCISQFDQVKKVGSAGYDAGLFRVHERNLSRLRKFMALSIWVMSFFAMIGLNAHDKYDSNRIALPKSWTNPRTLVATTIPGGWDVSTDANEQGQAIHIFTKASDAVQVVFASEDVPQGATLDAYIAAFVRSVKSNMTVSPYGDGAIVAGHEARVHVGELLSPKTPIEVTFVKRGDTVWRTVAVRHGGASNSPSIHALRAAVFLSVPQR